MGSSPSVGSILAWDQREPAKGHLIQASLVPRFVTLHSWVSELQALVCRGTDD